MTSQEQNFTRGALWRQMLLFSLPLMASSILQVLFNMSDVAVVGRFAGPVALGGVGSTTTLVTLFTGFMIGLGGGINVLAARCFGAGDKLGMERTVHAAALVALLAGLALLLCGQLFARPLLTLLHTKESLMPGALLYLRIFFLGMPATAIYNYGNAVFSAVGDTRRPLVYLLLAGILNIALNLFFVIFCRLDVAGVALATTIAQYSSAGMILVSLFRSQGSSYALQRGKLRLYRPQTARLLKLGLPAGFQTAIFAVANLFIQAAINSFSPVVVEGNAAAANADALVYDVMNAFYIAGATFIGQNLGAGNWKRVRKSYQWSLGYSFGLGAVMGLLLVLFSRQFLSLFTMDAEVMEAGAMRLLIMGFSYPVSAFMDSAIAAARGLGKTFVPTVIVVLGSCVFRIAWVYTVFAHFGTTRSLYLLFVCSWALTAVAEIIYFLLASHKLRREYAAPRSELL